MSCRACNAAIFGSDTFRRGRLRNVPASVRQRLLNCARERGEDFNFLLTRYANERLLHRLAASTHCDQFVLTGAVLFELWTATAHRATRDVDLLGYGEPAVEPVQAVFEDLCTLQVPPDGMRFLAGSVRAAPIRERQAESGIRVRLTADLDGARISLQVDVGFGDVVTPRVVETEFPTILDFPAPRLRTYSPEAVVAEKFEAIVRLGMVNTRMKDFYDLWIMASSFAFCGNSPADAFVATFGSRGTPLPIDPPIALRSEFSADAAKQVKWTAFAGRFRLSRFRA
ncbi:MAG: nucleotidyl transferase AbiEii/AbiGii toxin family protein [Gammaproteobacteria bacterium]|nr:nucleotidyl transferase AbiEii/AbiGii toxin family protein [Gammaproteobacteria bacterium]